MTEPIRRTMESMTGHDIGTCPWLAFLDPFVQRVMAAYQFFESGQLAFKCPNPTHRLVEGLAFMQSVSNRMQGKQMEVDREQRKRDLAQLEASRQGASRGR